MKKVILFVLSLAVLAAGVVYLLKTEREENGRVSTLYSQVEPLERERSALQEELESLETSYALKTRDYGTVEIFFPTLDPQVYSQAYPIMRDQGLVGVIGISPSKLPGQWNSMTRDDVDRLLLEGWGTCLVFENSWGGLNYWLQTVKTYLNNYGYDMPKTIYFSKNDDYSTDMDEALLEAGIENVVLNATGGRGSTVTDVSAPVWLTGAMPWNYTGFATDVELLGRTDGANLCFLVTFDDDPWDPDRRSYAQKSTESKAKQDFQDILQSWRTMVYSESPLDELDQAPSVYIGGSSDEVMQQMYLDSLTAEQQLLLPRFRVTTFEEARDFHLAAAQGNARIESEQEERKAELQGRIDELDIQIRQLYDDFNRAEEDRTQRDRK